MYAVGVDSGTQGTKVLIVDFESSAVLGGGFSAHKMVESLRPGESEQDPQVWVEAFQRALRQALKEAKIDPAKIVSLGVSAQQHGFVPLGKDGHPLRPAKLWNDTSTVEDTELLMEKLGGKQNYIEKVGIGLAVGYTASKILWLKRKEPHRFEKLATVLLPHNYLNFYLTGKIHMEYGDASGTGLMDIRKRVWHKEAIAAIDPELEAKLPPLSHPAEPVDYIRKEVASLFDFSKVLVSSGGGDNMMAAIGTGNVISGVCTVSLGTSGTIYSYFSEPFVDPEGEIAAFCDSTGGWLPLLCTMNVTNTTELFKSLFNLSNEHLEQLVLNTAPGADGLIFLPFINGERVPVLPFASGALFGLTRKSFDKAHLARSIMEGTILNLGYGFARMRALGLKPEEIRATGGGARSKVWLQIVANILKTPVFTLKEEEGAAYGAALQSIWTYFREKGEKVSIVQIAQERVKKGNLSVEPQPETFALYDSFQERFNSLWKTLTEEFKLLRSMPAVPE